MRERMQPRDDGPSEIERLNAADQESTYRMERDLDAWCEAMMKEIPEITAILKKANDQGEA